MSEQDKSQGSATNVQVVVAIIGLIGVLGAASLANWDKIFSKTHAPEIPAATTTSSKVIVDDFVGHWRNENLDTSGITKVEIDGRLNQVIVHVWGKCHPTDCDWGTQSVPATEVEKGVLQLTWDKGFSITKQQIRLLPDRRLEVVSQTHFADNSGRPDIEDVHRFLKQ